MTGLLKKKEESDVKSTSSGRHYNPLYEIERMFENFSSKGWLRPFHWDMPALDQEFMSLERKTPSVDVIDRDDEIVVKAEMPGVDKKDIDISISNNYLTIKGTTKHEEEEDRDDYYRCEISKGSYVRTVALPAAVNEDKVKATLKDGVLVINIKKDGETKKKSIKVD